jgi:hypothetical protein
VPRRWELPPWELAARGVEAGERGQWGYGDELLPAGGPQLAALAPTQQEVLRPVLVLC